MVAIGANVPVVAWRTVEQRQATRCRIARIVGANIVIVTILQPRSHAISGFTVIANSTGIAIITLPVNGSIETKTLSRTAIYSAVILVVALETSPGLTDSVFAEVVNGTGVPIGAAAISCRAFATEFGQTDIRGARVVIVTVRRSGPLADSVNAEVQFGTGVAIITVALSRFEETPLPLDAAIQGTHIAVVTKLDFGPDTSAVYATVNRGARVAITTIVVVGFVDTASFNIARIIGADVVVVAQGWHAGHATTIYALVSYATGIAIVAGETGVVRRYLALTGGTIADRLGTNRLRTLQHGARNYRRLVYLAEIRQARSVTIESAVAKVSILELATSTVLLAGAIHIEPSAHPFLAIVIHRARVIIVAKLGVEFCSATTQPVTGIIGAGIGIVAKHGQADAHPRLAVVPNSTGITILAFAFVKRDVVATGLAQTGIFGTLVAVVTELHVLALDQNRFVDFAIAIIVDAIAGLGYRHQRVAGSQSLFGADPLAMARTCVVGYGTRSIQGQLHRFIRAGTDPRISGAL